MDDVGTLIRHWRTSRRLSQQALAEEAEISARHLSCLETGRARPSREMVLVLASALEVPLRDRNTLLLAAGYAPAYRQTDLGDPALATVRRALEHMLVGAEPYGAVVVNRRWEVLMANRPWRTLAAMVLGREVAVGENLLALTLRPDGFRPLIRNVDALAREMLLRVHREAVTTADPELFALVEELEALDGVPSDWRRDPWEATPPVAFTIDLSFGDQVASLFTTMTTLGTPTDVNLSEIRIEHYFPADPGTEAILRGLFAST